MGYDEDASRAMLGTGNDDLRLHSNCGLVSCEDILRMAPYPAALELLQHLRKDNTALAAQAVAEPGAFAGTLSTSLAPRHSVVEHSALAADAGTAFLEQRVLELGLGLEQDV